MVSPTEVWALVQASIAFTLIEFFLYKLVQKELNSLQVADEVVSQLWTFEQKVNQLLKTGGKTIDKFTDQKHIFKINFIIEFK